MEFNGSCVPAVVCKDNNLEEITSRGCQTLPHLWLRLSSHLMPFSQRRQRSHAAFFMGSNVKSAVHCMCPYVSVRFQVIQTTFSKIIVIQKCNNSVIRFYLRQPKPYITAPADVTLECIDYNENKPCACKPHIIVWELWIHENNWAVWVKTFQKTFQSFREYANFNDRNWFRLQFN